MLVELIRVDDLIGQKLLAKLGRRQIIKSSIVLPKLSNLSRRGLGFEPDKRLQSAKKASLVSWFAFFESSPMTFLLIDKPWCSFNP